MENDSIFATDKISNFQAITKILENLCLPLWCWQFLNA